MLSKRERLGVGQGLLLTFTLLLAASNTLVGQQTAARPDRGVNPAGSYSVSDIENINMQSGNVQLSIPLASLPPIAGGRLSFGLSANYNSKLWNITRDEQEGRTVPTYRTYVVDKPQLSDVGGWEIGGTYEIFTRDVREDFNYVFPPYLNPNDPVSVYEYGLLINTTWLKTILRTPDGAEHELRPSGGNYLTYPGSSQTRPYLLGYYSDTPATTNSPTRYNSSDGTFLSVIMNPPDHPIRWTIFLPDGTKVIDYGSGLQRIRDNNGNSIKIFTDGNDTHYQDEQTCLVPNSPNCREIRVTYDPEGNGIYGQYKVWYQTVGGGLQHIDINMGETIVKGKIYDEQFWRDNAYDENGDLGVACERARKLLPQTVPVVREIVFPVTEQGWPARSFTFSYNSDTTESVTTYGLQFTCGTQPESYTRPVSLGLGELSHMVTPTGASVDYTYSLSLTHDFVGAGPSYGPDYMARTAITKKELHHDTLTDTWEYNIPNEPNSMLSSVISPDGSTVSQSYFASDPNFPQSIGNSSGGLNGLVFLSNNGVVKTLRHWVAGTQIATGANAVAGVNPLVDAEYTVLVGTTWMSARTYTHDANGNVTQVKEYDWFDSSQLELDSLGMPTEELPENLLLRVTNTSYHNSPPDTSSSNYYKLRTLASSTPSILNAVQQTFVETGVTTQFSYDGQSYGTAPTFGNLTSQSVWDDVDSKWITSSQTYDPTYGNLETKTDPMGRVTQFFYDDATHAMPNRVVVDPQNSTGTQTLTTAFDHYTGLVTSQTDPNGRVSSVEYTNHILQTIDPFGRPGLTIGRLVNVDGVDQRRRTRTTYEDHLFQVTVAADLNAENDQLLKSRITSDMLGRPVLNEQAEDGTNYTIYSRKAYAQMGKITFASNPMRYGPAVATDGWTRVTNDSVGRVVEVATFSGAAQPEATGYSNGTGIVTTVYDAIFTTVTDQAGKVRRSKTDALGRLVRVDEPDAGNSLGSTSSPIQATYYEYSVLGNLLTTTQEAQTRTFSYDSVSRLRSATNPEVSTPQGVPVPVTYVYDDNGNLTSKTDARGVVTTYGYDALNRVTNRSYTDGTPAVTYSYDSSAINGKGRLASVSSSVSTYTYSGYDATGNALGATQTLTNQAGSQAYTFSNVYGLSGQLKSMIYPSGRTVSYTYDNAGRSSGFSGNLGESVQQQQRTYTSSQTYSASGGMTNEQFGTDTAIYHQLNYNTRGQLWDTRVGTGFDGNTNWNRGALQFFYDQALNYGTSNPDNNGNVIASKHYRPLGESSSPWTISTDEYTYDELNRLTSVSETYEASGQGATPQFKQSYLYDRWGNRRICNNSSQCPNPNPSPSPAPSPTWGGVNNLEFEVEVETNRLLAPGDSALTGGSINQRKMRYDNAGNLVNDSWTGPGSNTPGAITRTYDAENRMTTALDTAGGTTQYYYDGDGRRVRRVITNQPEVWQVYGLGGELLAEYPANAPAASPQKEYGYRNGQLLVEVTSGTSWGSPPVLNDNPLNPNYIGETTVQLRHITELRLAIDALRTHMGMTAFSWQQSVGLTVWINPGPITEMRTALDQALGAPPLGYSAGLDHDLPIKAIHIQELRNRVLAAWSNGSALQVNWLVTDQLGTPRIIIDKSGALASLKRHDYLPFGEELTTQGLRNTMPGYASYPGDAGDNVRQKFTSKERDIETGLDYFLARYYSSAQGRFTSPDEFTGGPDELFDFAEAASANPTFYADLGNPQSLNKYQYTYNNPLRYTDPDGHCPAGAPCPVLEMIAPDAGIGAGKAIANIGLGMNNFMAERGLGEHVEPYKADNFAQDIGMIITEKVSILGAFLGGRPQVGGVLVAETKTTAQVAAISAADEVRLLPGASRPGAAGALVATNGQSVTATTKTAGVSAGVQGALDRVPPAQRSAFHGKCCEPRLISKAQNAGINVRGADISVVRVRGIGNAAHGTTLPACSSCRAVLDFYGIK
jgi:RHS repeat-associated protein